MLGCDNTPLLKRLIGEDAQVDARVCGVGESKWAVPGDMRGRQRSADGLSAKDWGYQFQRESIDHTGIRRQ